MRECNPKNERIKRRYTEYMRLSGGKSETTIDKALAAIARFERSTRWKGFEKFHIEQAIGFRDELDSEINKATGKPVAKGTVVAILKALRRFFIWLADQTGYRSRIRYSDADYFNPSNRDDRIARSAEQKPSPSFEQIQVVISRMPASTAVERRNRAILAFLILTGIRDGAAVGLKLRHVDLDDRSIRQDAREIRTKFSKTMTTWFFPVGDEISMIFADYVREMRAEGLFSPDDPLFPATRIGVGSTGGFAANGLTRRHWSSAAFLRKVVKEAFEVSGMPPYGPHSFRKTLSRLGERLCRTPEEFKAWSQNLGHDDVMTTFRSYGQVSRDRQREVLSGFAADGR
ncbi:MAG: tyrosine-type recombinase/integrase [Pseudomonadota bacterium]